MFFDSPKASAPVFTYDELFQFIGKNKILHRKINFVDLDAPIPKALLAAIKSGDVNAKIFFDPECEVYLLRLFRDKKIEPGEFLTVYSYLMGLMQFSDEVPLTREQLESKTQKKNTAINFKKICMHRLVEKGKLTKHGEEYIAKICKRYKEELNIDVNADALRKRILTLPPIEQTVIFLEADYASKNELQLLRDTVSVCPSYATKAGTKYTIKRPGNFMLPATEETRTELYPSFPSYSLHKYLLETTFDRPVQIAPRFGRVGDITLWKMHLQSKHIYPLYSKYVDRNMTQAHKRAEGPFTIAKHDEGHVVLASFLSPEMRKSIWHVLIPSLQEVADEISKMPESQVDKTRPFILLEELKRIIYDQLNDLAFFPISQYVYLDQTQRRDFFVVNKAFFPIYLYTLGVSPMAIKNIGEAGESNDLIYQILLLHHKGRNKDLWSMVLKYYPELPKNPIIQTLDTLAKAAAQPEKASPLVKPADVKLSVDWDAWQKKLAETNDSKLIWEWISKSDKLQSDLMQLIKCGLVFYHPFVPLTTEKHSELLAFVKSNTLEQTRLASSGAVMFAPDSAPAMKDTDRQPAPGSAKKL